MRGNGDEEEIGLLWIQRAEVRLSDVFEEEAFAGVFAGDFPRRLEERVGISVGVYVDFELPLHLRVIEPEGVRRVVDVGVIFILGLRNVNRGL